MVDLELLNKKFDDLKVCVIIPTYNNAGTLGNVITDVSGYTKNIIVINDGSTDHTVAIAQSFAFVNLITYPINVGKGWALRTAFAHATALGYDYALTIDSDGQHFAKDIPAFIAHLEVHRDALIIGSRNMDQAAVPGKSSFGHKFSNFWFKVETGKVCPDTQSGFRLYPLYLFKGMVFYTRKYEFEIEVLVRASWKGIPVESVPVTVYYAPKETRISHFRPFTDFTRVGILNAFLVVIAFAWIKPRDLVKAMSKKKSLKELLTRLFDPKDSDELKAGSIAFGIFMGIIPIWGFQLLVGIALAIFFRLNKALVVIAAHISIPPMIPFVIFLSYKAGRYWMGERMVEMPFSSKISFEAIHKNLEQYIYGSITLAIAGAIVVGLLTLVLLKIFKKKPLTLT